MPLWEYDLEADCLCLGERPKGGSFRPCDTEVIRYSAVTGALRSLFGSAEVHAAGYMVQQSGRNRIEYLSYSPHDDVAGRNVLPLTVQYLTNVLGRVIVVAHQPLPSSFDMCMGALKAQGMGNCRLHLIGPARTEKVQGELMTRIPLDCTGLFLVERVLTPVFGYLFRPTSPISGEYVRSIFEHSRVIGPQCLVCREDA